AAALREAYSASLPDVAYSTRAGILSALASYDDTQPIDTLKSALADREWAIRVRAAELLEKLEPGVDHASLIRPVPTPAPTPYDDPALLAPDYSPHVFIETP